MSEPYVRQSQTSFDAALSIKQDSSELRKIVLDYIDSQGIHGATDEEIQEATSMNQNTERPRRCELVARGIVVKSDAKRKTHSGRSAAIWVHEKYLRPSQVQEVLF